MIRILHILGGLDRGGAETMVMNIYRNIDRNIIQFDFVIHTPHKQAYYEEILTLGGKIYHFPAFNGKNLFLLKKLWKNFFETHKEYTILHSHVRSYASIYIPIAKKFGLKTIIHSHSTSNGSGIIAWIKKVMQYPLRYQADYLIACSEESARWLCGKNACKRNNYMIVPNAVDLEKYKYSKRIADCYRKQFGVENNYVIGHVGRFHESKNHMFLLDVFAGVYKKNKKAKLVLVGDGNIRNSIVEKIRSLGIENQVILTGSRSDIPQLMQMMDVFAFPSLWEGFPVSVVEAQAAGLPCLVSQAITNSVDLSELVRHLPIDDPNVWIEVLLENNFLRIDVSEKIKKAGFDVKETAESLANFYCTLEG